MCYLDDVQRVVFVPLCLHGIYEGEHGDIRCHHDESDPEQFAVQASESLVHGQNLVDGFGTFLGAVGEPKTVHQLLTGEVEVTFILESLDDGAMQRRQLGGLHSSEINGSAHDWRKKAPSLGLLVEWVGIRPWRPSC